MERYFKSEDALSRIRAALAVMDYFGINYSGIICCGYVTYDVNAQISPNGELDIGERLFSHSFGLIGAIMYHEIGVHWRMQFTQKDVVVDGIYTQAWFMREVQAYDYEISDKNIHRFGLTPDEVGVERSKRDLNFRYLTPKNRALVEKGIYKPQPSGL